MSGVHFDASIERGGFVLQANLEFSAGGTTAVIGPNGAGKSTLLAALAGLESAVTGTISIDGSVVDDPAAGVFVPSRDRRVGFVFQDKLLFPHLSVEENVAFGLRAHGRSKTEARSMASDLLGRDGLSSLASRRPDQLSGGQAQRVALVRALAIEPSLLLLDEPLSALDVQARTEVRQQLMERLESFAGVALLVTHDPPDAFLLADQIVVLEAGKVVQTGDSDQVRRTPTSAYVASFAGRNHLRAHVEGGRITVDGSDIALQSADRTIAGLALVSISPSAVALHLERPAGSPRNVWSTEVASIGSIGDVRRVVLGGPFELAADLTDSAVESMELAVGSSVWASVKATEVIVTALA